MFMLSKIIIITFLGFIAHCQLKTALGKNISTETFVDASKYFSQNNEKFDNNNMLVGGGGLNNDTSLQNKAENTEYHDLRSNYSHYGFDTDNNYSYNNISNDLHSKISHKTANFEDELTAASKKVLFGGKILNNENTAVDTSSQTFVEKQETLVNKIDNYSKKNSHIFLSNYSTAYNDATIDEPAIVFESSVNKDIVNLSNNSTAFDKTRYIHSSAFRTSNLSDTDFENTTDLQKNTVLQNATDLQNVTVLQNATDPQDVTDFLNNTSIIKDMDILNKTVSGRLPNETKVQQNDTIDYGTPNTNSSHSTEKEYDSSKTDKTIDSKSISNLSDNNTNAVDISKEFEKTENLKIDSKEESSKKPKTMSNYSGYNITGKEVQNERSFNSYENSQSGSKSSTYHKDSKNTDSELVNTTRLNSNDKKDLKDASTSQESEVSKEPSNFTNKTEEKEITSSNENDIISFNEWKVNKTNGKNETGQTEKKGSSKLKLRSNFNFASSSCGAQVVHYNNKARHVKEMLTQSPDNYALFPCIDRKTKPLWFIVQLCEPIRISSIFISNTEQFSSYIKFFKISITNQELTNSDQKWKYVGRGEFAYKNHAKSQSYNLEKSEVASNMYARYIKIEILEHHNIEFFCPISAIKVYGVSLVDELSGPHIDNSNVDTSLNNETSSNDEPTEEDYTFTDFNFTTWLTNTFYTLIDHIYSLTKYFDIHFCQYDWCKYCSKSVIRITRKYVYGILKLLRVVKHWFVVDVETQINCYKSFVHCSGINPIENSQKCCSIKLNLQKCSYSTQNTCSQCYVSLNYSENEFLRHLNMLILYDYCNHFCFNHMISNFTGLLKLYGSENCDPNSDNSFYEKFVPIFTKHTTDDSLTSHEPSSHLDENHGWSKLGGEEEEKYSSDMGLVAAVTESPLGLISKMQVNITLTMKYLEEMSEKFRKSIEDLKKMVSKVSDSKDNSINRIIEEYKELREKINFQNETILSILKNLDVIANISLGVDNLKLNITIFDYLKFSLCVLLILKMYYVIWDSCFIICRHIFKYLKRSYKFFCITKKLEQSVREVEPENTSQSNSRVCCCDIIVYFSFLRDHSNINLTNGIFKHLVHLNCKYCKGSIYKILEKLAYFHRKDEISSLFDDPIIYMSIKMAFERECLKCTNRIGRINSLDTSLYTNNYSSMSSQNIHSVDEAHSVDNDRKIEEANQTCKENELVGRNLTGEADRIKHIKKENQSENESQSDKKNQVKAFSSETHSEIDSNDGRVSANSHSPNRLSGSIQSEKLGDKKMSRKKHKNKRKSPLNTFNFKGYLN